jgi:Na+/melibiose symporter-like transporter
MFSICSEKAIGSAGAMSLVYNERTKLTATWFSGLATAFMAAGLFAPLAALAYGVTQLRTPWLYLIALIILCVSVGGVLTLDWSPASREPSRMTNTEFLQLLSLVTPVAILLVVLGVARLFIWQDNREMRRRNDKRRLNAPH